LIDPDILKLIHILSSTVLFGAGLGAAFHGLASNLRKDVAGIVTANRNVVLADWLFTTPAVIIQPVTGARLATGQSLAAGLHRALCVRGRLLVARGLAADQDGAYGGRGSCDQDRVAGAISSLFSMVVRTLLARLYCDDRHFLADGRKTPVLTQRAMTKPVRIDESWKKHLGSEFEKTYFIELREFVRNEYASGAVYPPAAKIFRAFDECPFDKVKVVVLGQDPYHGPGQANGLCFAVGENVPPPPSLQNIFKEIEADLGHPVSRDPDLSRWAQQGVLLLNATLTVRASQAGSHQNKGWEQFTDAAVHALSREREGVVFMLWGSYARRKGAGIDRHKHLVLECAHPSPLSAHNGFFGCRHFSKANDYLIAQGQTPIEW
jgi:uracil-DNA glycosylase